MRVPVEEREVHIGGYVYNEDGTKRDYFEVYTSDYGYMAKFDKLCEQFPEHWRHREKQPEWKQGGDIVGKFYECSIECILMRGRAPQRNLSDEQRERLAERGRESIKHAQKSRFSRTPSP